MKGKIRLILYAADIGFAMKFYATRIKEADISKGYYCDACNNVERAHRDRVDSIHRNGRKEFNNTPRYIIMLSMAY